MPFNRPYIGHRQARAEFDRRTVLAGAAALSVAGAFVARADDQEVRFGLTPVMLTSDLDLLDTLRRYLEDTTGVRVRLITKRTYQEITALLLSGQLDAAWICGYPYIRYADRLSLVAVPVWRGQPLYRSYLIVGKDRQISESEQLKGDVHAFSDPDSNSGFLVTEALLVSLGHDPRTFFSRTFFTYGHRNVVRAVASGLAHSGSVDGYVWEVLAEAEPEMTARTRVFRRSELLGFPPIAAARSIAEHASVRAVRDAFLRMSSDPTGRLVLQALYLDGFTPGSPSLFDGIAAKYASVRDYV